MRKQYEAELDGKAGRECWAGSEGPTSLKG